MTNGELAGIITVLLLLVLLLLPFFIRVTKRIRRLVIGEKVSHSVAHTLDTQRDKHLLKRARRAAKRTGGDYVRYSEDDLKRLEDM